MDSIRNLLHPSRNPAQPQSRSKTPIPLAAMTVIAALTLAACGGSSDQDSNGTAAGDEPDADRPHESPMLTELVEAGDLPELEDRLPVTDDRLVLDVEQYGIYGDTYQGMSGGPGDEAWFHRMIGFEPMLRPSEDLSEIGLPGTLKEVDTSEDGTEYTLHLREGLRWSDGEEVTADDVMFAIEEVYLNEELYPSPVEILAVEGDPAEAEKVDDYTVLITFPGPKGNFIDRASREITDGGNFFHYPKHYFEDFLPDLNPEADEFAEQEGFSDWVSHLENQADYLNNPEKPTLLPWVVVDPVNQGTVAAFERNPFYWKVDDDGAQLPYIDRMEFEIIAENEVMLMKVLNGEIDFHARHIETPANRPVLADAREEGRYDFSSIQSSSMSNLIVALNLNHEDPDLRDIFNNKDFRIGLSHAINRQDIIDTVYQRQGEPWQAAPHPDSEFASEEFGTQYIEYDVDLANEYLDEAGLTERGSDGYRLLPNGDPLQFAIDINAGSEQMAGSADLITQYWQEVGVNVSVNPVERTLFMDRKSPASNQHDANTWGGDGGLRVEMTEPRWYFPFSNESNFAVKWAEWFQSRGASSDGEEPPEDVRRQMELYWEILEEPDLDRQDELFQEIIDIAQEQFYAIGVTLPPEMYAMVSYDMHNVPQEWIDSPVYQSPGPQNPSTWFIDRENPREPVQ